MKLVSCSSVRPLKVTILAPRWSFSLLDSSCLLKELAVQLAKHRQVQVTLVVPENACSESDKREADNYRVNVVEAKEHPGFDDPVDWLSFPPEDLCTDIVVGVGERLGKIAELFKTHQECKSIYVTCSPYEGPRNKLSAFLERNTGISQMADLSVAIGPKMADELAASLCFCKKKVFNLTPGINNEFRDVSHATSDREKFRILISGGDDPENFDQEGLGIAAKAVAQLDDKGFQLLFIGAAEEEKLQKYAEKFCQCGIARSQLNISSTPKREEEWKGLFCKADLAIMPSSEQGFGMMALAALSSGLPVLVHGDSGFGEALQPITFGASSIEDSEDAKVWAKAIKAVQKKNRKNRLEEAALLRAHYDEKYSWKKQYGVLVETMSSMVSGMNVFILSIHALQYPAVNSGVDRY